MKRINFLQTFQLKSRSFKNAAGGGIPKSRYCHSLLGLTCLSTKKRVIAVLLFFIALSSVFAVPHQWSWEKEDDRVQYYRYQLNSESEEGWTVVDSNTTTVKLDGIEGENILYVQASYDGEHWSESGFGTYNEMQTEEPKIQENLDDNVDNIEETNDLETEHEPQLQPQPEELSADESQCSCLCTFQVPKQLEEKHKYEITLKVSPYSLQRIAYSGQHIPQSRTSVYGNGIGLEFIYNFEPRLAVGTNFYFQWHNFKSFHYYYDLKADVRLRYRVFSSDNLRYKLYLEHGVGVDCVLRDDDDFGCYLLVSVGLNEDLYLSNEFSANWGCDFNYSFQDGSSVFHFTTFLGATYHWGNNAK